MFKIAAALIISFFVLFTYLLCRASSLNKDWEAEDEEQVRFLASLSEKGK